MKIRTGFVSNSSSSSFCLYGVYMDTCDFEEKIIAMKPELEGEDSYEIFESLDTSLSIEFYYDTVYIGRSWGTVEDDETGKQFKKGVEKEIEEIFSKNLKCSTHEEAWQDG